MIQNMEKHFDVKNDYLYIKGIKDAQETEQTKFVKNLLIGSDFSVDKIADIAGVSVDFVKAIKKEISIS
jgi:adenine-specific DNA methylase